MFSDSYLTSTLYLDPLLTSILTQVHIPIDSISKQPKGLAYVKFKQPSSALAAYDALDKKSFQGRLLHVLPAVERKGKIEVIEGDEKKKSLKDERNAKRKATAGRDFNWGMLYMNVRQAFVTLLSMSRSLIHIVPCSRVTRLLRLSRTV